MNLKTIVMKKFNFAFVLCMAFFPVSCTTDAVNENATNLVRKETFYVNGTNPTLNTKRIQYYSNYEITADSTFNHLNQFTHRRIIITNGLTKTYQTLDANKQIIEHRERTYDTQGRIVGRRDIEPISALTFTYTYNPDNTVTSTYYNSLDQETTAFRTYHKNSNGLIYKEFASDLINNNTIETTSVFDNNNKLLSLSNGEVFQYFSNPMPANLIKSVNQLNNEVIIGNELRRMALFGNYYFKTSNNVITTFNTNNYISYQKSTNDPTVTIFSESFYYYN
jgi:hypothetical protein